MLPTVLVLLGALLLPSSAAASRQPVDFFGGEGTEGGKFSQTFSSGIAINYSGAGGVPIGTIYVTDQESNRLQRFQRNDGGTPNDTTDDTYAFVSAWGADVDGGGTDHDYEICTIAAACGDGTGIGGNGTLPGNGAFGQPSGLDVDQDTGEVYVVDGAPTGLAGSNFRVSVYGASGAFLRSFGWDVVETGPNDNGAGYEICKAGIDVCKSGLPGSGMGQVGFESGYTAEDIAVSPPDGNPDSGTVFLADEANLRINTYNLDGSSPGSIGSTAIFGTGESFQYWPRALAVDSRGILYATNKSNIERYDSQNANGGGVGFLAPIASGVEDLSVDPDSDGVGPDSDVLYTIRQGPPNAIRQFGPLNAPGLATPPSATDEIHGTAFPYERSGGVAIEPPTERLYVITGGSPTTAPFSMGVFVLDNESASPPAATLDSLSSITARSVVANATIDPNGPPNTSYHFEYSTDQVGWTPMPTVVLGHQTEPQPVTGTVGLGAGLRPNTHYYVRLVAGRNFGTPVVSPALDFTTDSAPPIVETTGSPVRTATSAQLNGRVTPSNAATEYHFEYGDEGSCNVNPCVSTPVESAGAGEEAKLVTAQIEGLQPGTSYHYRLIADNGHSSGPAIGEDMTVTTRTSDAPLSHGRFPGPPGSDRAYEQVSLPDTGGNPVLTAYAVSDDGNRAFYRVSGGTPLSVTGTLLTMLYAERTPSGWRSEDTSPQRDRLVGGLWLEPAGLPDLSSQVAMNGNSTGSADAPKALWRMQPGAPPVEIFTSAPGTFVEPAIVSEDASRVLAVMNGSHDPAHPTPPNSRQLYDISSGTPRLVSLLPSGIASECEVRAGGGASPNFAPTDVHWISADGSLAFFESCGGLYMRDLDAEETFEIGAGSFVRWTPGGVFFASGRSLVSDDSGGGDIYRYDLGDRSLDCITCVVAGLDAQASASGGSAVVAPDGSRVYFKSSAALLPGAAVPGTYRVEVASGELAYVGPGVSLTEDPSSGGALSADGSALIFTSSSPSLNALGGQQNGGSLQYYRYDDRNRSLTCISCPQDGGVPGNPVKQNLIHDGNYRIGANRTALSRDGETFAFATNDSLLPADQNTARAGQVQGVGGDIYEWRDGRLLLITEGLGEWPGEGPLVSAITPSGNDIFFTAFAQYTKDALDAHSHLYTARIGGGIEFPPPPKPCPLEVCQGTPRGAPEEQVSGTSSFSGSKSKASTPSRRPCPRGRHKTRKAGKTRCVKSQAKSKTQRKKRQRAKHDRRTAR